MATCSTKKNTLVDINALELTDAFEDHVTKVYDCVSDVHDSHATCLYESARFCTMKSQLEWREKRFIKLYLHVQKICSGESRRQVEVLTYARVREVRVHFMLRYGGSPKSLIYSREKEFLAGLPAENSKVAFRQYCNMEDKLFLFETERTFNWKTCPVECRGTYVYCQDPKMIHVILEHLPFNYDQAVEKVCMWVKMRIMVSDTTADVSTSRDIALETYSDDWPPPYDELWFALVDAWNLMKLCWNIEGESVKVPSMKMGRDHQPDAENSICYSCGVVGHKRCDPVCEVKAGDILEGTRESWKSSWFSNKMFTHGKSINNEIDRSNKNRVVGVCLNWSIGNGYCRNGSICRFAHTGNNGGEGRDNGNGNGNGNKKGDVHGKKKV